MRKRAHGPYRHGRKWRVHFVSVGPRGDRTTTYEIFASRSDAQKCYDDATDEAQGITVISAIAAYLEAVRARGARPLTMLAYEGRLNLLLESYLKRPLRSIQHRGAELYAAAVVGRSPDAHQNLLTAGRLFGKWCLKQRWLRANPFADVEAIGRRVHGADKVRLTVDESRKLEAWCLAHPDDQGAVLTLAYLYLGIRNSELVARDIRDLDDNGQLLWIGRTKSTSGRRKLRVPEALGALLRERCDGRPGDAPIFTGDRVARMPTSAALSHVRRVCGEAGVPVVPPQALRRTQSSLATEAGETSLAVARHLGHASAQVAATSYVDRDSAADAQGERALRVIRGGKA